MITPNSSEQLRTLLSIAQTRLDLGGVSRAKVYELLGAGQLRAVKIGTRTLITAESVAEFVARLPPARFAAPSPPLSTTTR